MLQRDGVASCRVRETRRRGEKTGETILDIYETKSCPRPMRNWKMQAEKGKLVDNANDLRIVSMLRAVRDGIDAIGYVDTESFLYIKNVFSSKHGDVLFRTKWK